VHKQTESVYCYMSFILFYMSVGSCDNMLVQCVSYSVLIN